MGELRGRLSLQTCIPSVSLQDEDEAVDIGEGLEEWTNGKVLKPTDQLELTETVSEGWEYSLMQEKALWQDISSTQD